MLSSENYAKFRDAISRLIREDRAHLEELRRDVQVLKNQVRAIKPRQSTAISLVATDGGNNQLRFDPFFIEILRVVDSSNNEYWIEAVSHLMDIDSLDRRHIDGKGNPLSVLGEMMTFLQVKSLRELSPMIPRNREATLRSTSWIQVYRELIEWSILFSLFKKDYGSDTLIVFDGLLRSKVFSKDLFPKLLKGIEKRIQDQEKNRRKVYLVGIAKHSKVLDRYHLALALEGVLQREEPLYVEVPRELEQKSYIWSEYARGDDVVGQNQEVNKFVGGKMFLVKFGRQKYSPVWPVDVFQNQAERANEVFGLLLNDALNGFPIPYYPLCLQRAHEHAALVEFDLTVLQDLILQGIRDDLNLEKARLDEYLLQDRDPSKTRYGKF